MEVRHYPRFSDLVKAARQKKRLSQRALARLLKVSPGYVGQWELRLSQPSPEMVERFCRLFQITDIHYVQKLAFAERAPEWLKDAIVSSPAGTNGEPSLLPIERRMLDAVRKLPPLEMERLAERLEGWVEAKLDKP